MLTATIALTSAVLVQTAPAQAASGGQLFASGYNGYGALGLGNRQTKDVFVPVPGMSEVVQVAGGEYSSVALLANGTVEAWGYNAEGEVGNDTESSTGCECVTSPVTVSGIGGVGTLSDAVAVSAGAYDSLALLANGHVVAWGEGSAGQLGDGATSNSDYPVEVEGVGGTGKLSEVVAISAGYESNVALLANGHVVAWGYGAEGELGDGATSNSDYPVEVEGVGGTGTLSEVTAISAGGYHVLALLADHHVAAWGYGGDGQLGDGATSNSDYPVEVEGIGGSGALSEAMTIATGYDFSLALLANGTVSSWGYGYDGELGTGVFGDGVEADSPVQVPGLSGVSAIDAGAYYANALTTAGALFGWGLAEYGELGDGFPEQTLTPTLNTLAPGASALMSHGSESYASFLIGGDTAQLSATELAFPGQVVATRSSPESVTITNAGPQQLFIAGDSLAGSGDFVKQADSCAGARLAAGASCTISVTFSPSAADAAWGELVVSSNATNALPAIQLDGFGIAASTASKSGTAHAGTAATVKNGSALLQLTCSNQGPCKGSLKLVARVPAGTSKGKRHSGKRTRSVVIGTASFSLGQGKRNTVHVHLSAKGRSFVREAGRRGLKVTVEGSDIKSAAVVLKQARVARRAT